MNIWFLIICMVGSGCFAESIQYRTKEDCMKAEQAITAEDRWEAICVPNHSAVKDQPNAR